MSNRTAAIAFAAVTGCATAFGLTSLSGSPASAADECLTAPKASTPAGAHWYYRLEKGTKRKCWYLADEGGKTKKAAAPAPASSDVAEEDAPPPGKITPPVKQEASKKTIQKSIANARAELRAGTDDDPALAETTWPAMPKASADADIRKDNQAAAIQPAPETNSKQNWNVATRWPEPGAAASSASDQPAAAPSQPAQPAPVLTAERLATAAATPAPPPAPIPAVTTGAATQQPQPSIATVQTDEGFSIRILLSILVGVMALTAILGPLLFKYFRPKPREDDRTYSQRRPIWDLNESERPFAQDYPPLADETHYVHETGYSRILPEARVLDSAVDELEQLLARAAKRPAA